MTEIEKQQILTELEARITEKMKGTLIKEDTGNVLSDTRKKWFNHTDGINQNSLMFKVFGTYIYWNVWDCIRKLTCYICGTSYVRNIKDTDFANSVADAICQIVYDYAIKYREKENNPTADQSTGVIE